MQILGILCIVLMFMLLTYYVYGYVLRICRYFSHEPQKRYILLFATVVINILCSLAFGTTYILMLLHIIITDMIARFVVYIINRHKEINFMTFLVAPIITCIIMTAGYYNMHNVVKTTYEVYTDKSIREEGYRILLVADVHFGVSLTLNEVNEKCKEMSGEKADIVVLCGDITDESASKEDMENIFEALGNIESKEGIYYVYGNHDRQLYSADRVYEEKDMEEAMKNAGITVLRDETVTINDEVVIAGREDKSYDVVKKRKDIQTLLEDVSKDKFIITLDHQPKEYRENVLAGTDLMLSGHTHGGQIWPANFLFEIIKFDDGVYGRYEPGENMTAIVTSGFAGWGFPIKTASPAEYVVIDIKDGKYK